jgi:hypothetical protein
LVIEIGGEVIIPIEVKYQSQPVQMREIPGLIDLCGKKPSIQHAYIITKSPHDIGPLQNKYLKIPASLFCYWLGASEFHQKNILT